MFAALKQESVLLPAYIVTTFALSTAGTIALLAGLIDPGPTADFDLALFLVLTGTAGLLEWNGTDLFGESRVSLSFIPLFVIALLLGAAPASVAALLTIWVAELVRRKPPHKTVFNAATVSIATATGGLVFNHISGPLDTAELHWQLVPAALAALVTFTVNSGLVAGVVAISSGRGAWAVWDEKFRWLVPHYAALGLTAFAVAAAYRSLDFLGLAVFAIPIAVLRLSMQQYISRARAEVERTREAHAALGESEERLRMVMETAQGGIVVLDPTGKAVFSNNALGEMLGYTREELAQLPLAHVLPREDRAVMYERLAAQARGEDVPTHFVQRVIRKDGREVELEIQAAPFQQAGETVGSLVELRDVTEQRALQRAVAEAAEEVASILEAAPSGVVVIDAGGEIIRSNPSAREMFGWSGEDLVGRQMSTLVPDLGDEPPERWSSPQPDRTAVLDRFREATGLRRDGSRFPLALGADAIGGRVDDDRHFVVIVQDLTDRKIAEQDRELARLATARSEFLATMSHELRTPLNGIIGFGELLAAGIPDELTKPQQSHVHDIIESSAHLLSLITDVLDLSKVDSGRYELRPVHVDVNDLLAEVLRGFEPEAARQGVRLALAATGPLQPVRADHRAFRQILLNLVANALKFTEHGRVEVHAYQPGDDTVIEVVDTGIGIPSDRLGEIFDEFTQVNSGYSRQYAGTGLGLAITRRLVTMHGGSVEVESELGEGSTFRVRLPNSGPPVDGLDILDEHEVRRPGVVEHAMPAASRKI